MRGRIGMATGFDTLPPKVLAAMEGKERPNPCPTCKLAHEEGSTTDGSGPRGETP